MSAIDKFTRKEEQVTVVSYTYRDGNYCAHVNLIKLLCTYVIAAKGPDGRWVSIDECEAKTPVDACEEVLGKIEKLKKLDEALAAIERDPNAAVTVTTFADASELISAAHAAVDAGEGGGTR